MPGETPFQTVSRLLKREVDLHIDAHTLAHGRLELLTPFSFHWAQREQQPHPERGTCDVSCIHMLRVSDAEAQHAIAHLDPKEYAQIAFVDAATVTAADSKFHPALQRAVHAIDERRRYRALEAIVAGASDDAAVAEAARAYIRAKCAATAGDKTPLHTLDFL